MLFGRSEKGLAVGGDVLGEKELAVVGDVLGENGLAVSGGMYLGRKYLSLVFALD